jgi:hypothetical protein
MTLVHARGPEDRDRRPPDPLHGLESLEELFADPRGVSGEVAFAALE